MHPAFAGAFVAATMFCHSASAQTCTPNTYPYTLTDGQVADATQVMADLSCPAYGLAHSTSNIGIQMTSPQAPLSIGSLGPGTSEPTWHGYIQIAGGADITTGVNGLEFKTSVYAAGFGWLITSPDRGNGNVPLSFASRNSSATWTERLTLRSDTGYVGIGTTAPTYPLYVNGQAGGTTTWSSTSDARLKEDVVQISGALGLVERLRGVRYRWRPPSEREVGKALDLPTDQPQVGFIAQEVEAVDTPKTGSSDIYSLKDSKLIPILVEAIKEQQAEIQKQESKIERLEAETAARSPSK